MAEGSLVGRLKEKGLKVTKARLAILALLDDDGLHLSADDIKALLDKKQVSYTEHMIDLHADYLDELRTLTDARTVPQIFINDHHVGGCDDLYALESAGNLDDLLSK